MIFILVIVNSMLMNGCMQSGNSDADIEKIVIKHNDKELQLDGKQKAEFIEVLKQKISKADDFYELLVTSNLVDQLRKEDHLYVSFPEPIDLEVGKFGGMKANQMLIPLAGKFASENQMTIFSGINNLSNTPLISSDALNELMKLLDN